MESPELRPLPPLARLPAPPLPAHSDAGSEEEDEEFYSPRGSSLGGRESSIGTESGSRRVFSAVSGENFAGRTSSSRSSSSSVSPEQSHSITLSPPASFSPRRRQPKSPETTPPHNAELVSSSTHNQNVQSSSCSCSSSFSSSRSTPERDSGEEDTHSPSISQHSSSPNKILEKNPNGSSEEKILESNEDPSLSLKFHSEQELLRLSNASSESGNSVSSSSAFSLPSSPEKMVHHHNFDQSPRISSVSDRFKLPGLSSLPLSPTLLSSPETERGFIGFFNAVPQRKQWEIPVLSTASVDNVVDQTAGFPVPPQRKQWEVPILSTRVAPLHPLPPPPPPPPLQQQRRQWETPPPLKAVGEPIWGPPELMPPSRPFVLKKPATNVSPVELPLPQSLREAEEPLKPRLKALHWDKVRTSSSREMAWDQLKSSSFR